MMKLMTPQEVAEKANVSLSLVYQILRSGKLKAMRIGARGRGKWLVLVEDFDAWIQSCKLSEKPQEDGAQPYAFL